MSKEKVIEILNLALKEELTALMQYLQHHYIYQGSNSPAVRDLFKDLSMNEMKHAYTLGERIAVLGGIPTTKPDEIKQPKKGKDMIKVDLEDELKAVQDYKKWLKAIPPDDPVSRLMLEKILGDEEEHVAELQALLGE